MAVSHFEMLPFLFASQLSHTAEHSPFWLCFFALCTTMCFDAFFSLTRLFYADSPGVGVPSPGERASVRFRRWGRSAASRSQSLPLGWTRSTRALCPQYSEVLLTHFFSLTRLFYADSPGDGFSPPGERASVRFRRWGRSAACRSQSLPLGWARSTRTWYPQYSKAF